MGTPILIAADFANPASTQHPHVYTQGSIACAKGPVLPKRVQPQETTPSCGRHVRKDSDRPDRMDPDKDGCCRDGSQNAKLATHCQTQLPALPAPYPSACLRFAAGRPRRRRGRPRPPARKAREGGGERGNEGRAATTMRNGRGRAAAVCAHRNSAKSPQHAARGAAGGAARTALASPLTTSSFPLALVRCRFWMETIIWG